jgi:putative sigma-54 modulation protein
MCYTVKKIPKREGVHMKTNITGKNYTPSENLREIIEKKFAKLDKYFSDEITGNVMVIKEKDGYKVEATIRAKGTIFRSEVKAQDPYDAVDRIIDKLSSQMAKFKTKLQKKHKGHKEVAFDEIPDAEPVEELTVVKKKKFELVPMTVEEAIVQMELVEHSFFVFTNIETDAVNVVYKREDGAYGVLETV